MIMGDSVVRFYVKNGETELGYFEQTFYLQERKRKYGEVKNEALR